MARVVESEKMNVLTSLYTDLHRHGQNGDFDKALKAANKILQESSDEEKAFHCKVVSQIQLGKFEDALSTLRKNQRFGGELLFEKAYCEYRLNRTRDALKTLRGVERPDDRMKELLAQVTYRLEDYGQCVEIYKDLLKNTQDEFEEERETNLSAVLAAQQTWGDGLAEDIGLREDTYELCYNRACLEIGNENFSGATDKLNQAESLCRQMFDDDADATEEDVDAELSVIRAQMGYVLQRLGKSDEAMKSYNTVIRQRPDDVSVAAVVSNNIITLNKDQSVFESQKRIKALQVDGLQQKLTSSQRRAITTNQSLFYMLQTRSEQCRKLLQGLLHDFPESETPALVEAALACKEKQTSKAIETLKSLIEQRPDSSLTMKLTLAQLQLTQGQVYQAAKLLRALGDDSYRPGIVSALVSLYLSQEDSDSASEVLSEAVEWCKKKQPNSENYVLFVRANANFQLMHGSPNIATQMLEELRRRNQGDIKTLAQLISAYSKFDPKKAQEVSKDLPPSEELSRHIDVATIEASASLLGPRYIKKASGRADQPSKPLSPKLQQPEESVIKKKKKKRKVKLPKSYDPSATPDPERWNPLRERSYYRGRRKKQKGKDIGKGTQGAVSAAALAELDKSAAKAGPGDSATGGAEPNSPKAGSSGAATPTPTSAAAAPAPAPAPSGPRQQKPQGGKQKKKKKGSKW